MSTIYNYYAFNSIETKGCVNIIAAYQSTLKAPFYDLYKTTSELKCALLTISGTGIIKMRNSSVATLTDNNLYFQNIKDIESFAVKDGTWSFVCIWFYAFDIDIPAGEIFKVQSSAEDIETTKQIIRHMREPGFWGIRLANAIFLQKLLQWLQIVSQKSDTIPANNSIGQIIKYIDEHIEENINIEHLADLSCYSSKHFRYLFAKKMGMLPKKYLLIKKMNRVAFLLIFTDLSIGEISERCNFSSPYNMSLTFKSYFKISPSEFRKSNGLFIFDTSPAENREKESKKQ